MNVAGTFQSARILFSSFSTQIFFVFLLGLILRFASLDLKLFHHDEAIHAWFAYELLTKGTYVYDPMYHGPLLYYLTAGMFFLLGSSDLVGRLLPALFGTLLVPLVYAMYTLGYLDRKQALIAALFVAVSPDLVYFSRFLRHDIFQLFFTLLILVALLAYIERKKSRYALVAGLAIGGGMCLKEDMPLFLVLLAIFGIYLLWRRDGTVPATWRRDLIGALLIATGVMALFYSSFGMHPEVLETGLFKAFDHWTAMHGQCRICGPWFFYIILFLLYELPVFILALWALGEFSSRHNPLAGITAHVQSCTGSLVRRLRKTGEVPIPGGEQGAAQSSQKSAHRSRIDRKELFFFFTTAWFLSTLAAYAYIGEKVPWLIIHQLLPAILLSVYLMGTRKMVFALAGCVFLLLMAVHVAFIPADINEPIVQVQNSEDMRTVMALIDASDSVAIASENYWPLPWYYRGGKWNRMHFYGKIVDEDTIYQLDPDMVITHDQASFVSLSGYEKRTYKLAYWFSIYDNENRIPEYYVKRDGKMGSINLDIFTKPGLFEKAGMTPSPALYPPTTPSPV
ncbi:MAG: TIGR03663 family protein [Methanolinea sp.]|nr:TIGR03663 family protein [Methanolinea sp.]